MTTKTKKSTAEMKSAKKKALKKKATGKPKTVAKKAAGKKAATKKTGKPSYVDRLRDLFKSKDTRMTLEQIAKSLGTDARNASVTISIAKNPNRTKRPFVLERNKSTGNYKRV